MSRIKYELIVVAVLALVGLAVFGYIKEKPKWEANAKRVLLVEFAEKQALEIRIIEQSSKLARYKRQIRLSNEKAAKETKKLVSTKAVNLSPFAPIDPNSPPIVLTDPNK